MKPGLRNGRQSAQVVVLFALGLVSFMALVGLAVDGGTLYLQRRTAQSAADAAALAGTRALQQATQQTTTSVGDAICQYLLSNAFGVTPTATAFFVDVNNNNLASISLGSGCAGGVMATIPMNAAAGVRVNVTIGPYATRLAGIIGIRDQTVVATSTARIGSLSIPLAAVTQFAACGDDMLRNGNAAEPFVDILTTDNQINDERMGSDVILQGSQMTQNQIAPQGANCPAWNGSSSSWKGKINIGGLTGPLTLPMNLPVDTGNGSIDDDIRDTCLAVWGPVDGDLSGKDGTTSRCYLLVPVAGPPHPSNQAHIVALACFRVYEGSSGAEKWRGVLMPTNTCNYATYELTWTFGMSSYQTQVMLSS